VWEDYEGEFDGDEVVCVVVGEAFVEFEEMFDLLEELHHGFVMVFLEFLGEEVIDFSSFKPGAVEDLPELLIGLEYLSEGLSLLQVDDTHSRSGVTVVE
jgi:hypothetical protein